MRILAAFALLALAVPASAEAKTNSCVRPLAGWQQVADGYPQSSALNWLSLRTGMILWNNLPIGEEQLLANLKAGRQTNPVTFLIFDPSSADCDFARRIQAMVDSNYPCRQGACVLWTPKLPSGR